MNAFALALTALVTSMVFSYWRNVQERQARWRLYALRDRLRWIAICREDVRNSKIFARLDFSLTFIAANLDRLTLWTVLSMRYQTSTPPPPEPQTCDPEVARVVEDLVHVLVKYLIIRHCAIAAVMIVTVVGPVLLWVRIRNIARAIAKDGIASDDLRVFGEPTARTA